MGDRGRRGFTLIEVIVVLTILVLAGAIVLPAMVRPRDRALPLQRLIDDARDAAAHRGEIIYLRVEPTGAWRMEGGGSPLESDSAVGRIAPLATIPITLIVSPAGSCALDVRSAPAAPLVPIDPLSCTIVPAPHPATGSATPTASSS